MKRNEFKDYLDPSIPEEAAVLNQGNVPIISFPAGTSTSEAIELLKRTKLGIKKYKIGVKEVDEYITASEGEEPLQYTQEEPAFENSFT